MAHGADSEGMLRSGDDSDGHAARGSRRASRDGRDSRGDRAHRSNRGDRTSRASRTNRTGRGSRAQRHQPPQRPYSEHPFHEVIDVTDVAAERRRLGRSLVVMRVIALLLLVAAVVVAGFPLVLQYRSSLELSQTSSESAAHVEGWPYPQAERTLEAAHEYNRKLAQSGQPILGEAVDPFLAEQGGSHAKGEDSAASKDADYQAQLDSGSGVMGTIKVPSVSIELPIYHGTSETALASGAGHLYGTSLPVGGESTHSVITGHRGLVEALMFTRLDEMKQGDFFYIEVMGETLGYEVDRISVITPDDTSQLRIVEGEDRVTLMTCTPYGVNTHRLLVSGHRVEIPLPAPDPGDVHDARNVALLTGGGLLLGGWLLAAMVSRLRHAPWRVMRHAASRPR